MIKADLKQAAGRGAVLCSAKRLLYKISSLGSTSKISRLIAEDFEKLQSLQNIPIKYNTLELPLN